MKQQPAPHLDARTAEQLARQLLARRAGYLEAFAPRPGEPGGALVAIAARYLEAVLERLERAPEKNGLALLEMLGIELIPARAARAPVVFQLGAKNAALHLPAGARVAAPPPPEGKEQIVFESERAAGLGAGRLARVVSLWPGRDQWLDHAEEVAAGQGLELFDRARLTDTPHALYLAHDTLLALAGKARVEVELEVTQGGSELLDVRWQYWDGEVWRGFREQCPECKELGESLVDGTGGLRRSGRYRLTSDCAESALTTVGAIKARWIRGLLAEPLPSDPRRVLPELTQIRLSTVLEHGAVIRRARRYYLGGDPKIVVWLVDGNGQVLKGAQLRLVGPPGQPPESKTTNDTGVASFALVPIAGTSYRLELALDAVVLHHDLPYVPPDGARPWLLVALTLEPGFHPDAAFADAIKLDVTKPFYPFGQQPRPGSTFYLASEEVLAKPGARLAVHVRKASTPEDEFTVASGAKTLERQLAWEYWDGRRWQLLRAVSGTASGSADDFTASGVVTLTIPDDVTAVEVNGQEKRWLRVRVVSGAFGFTNEVTWQDSGGHPNSFTYVISRPPALADLRLAYVWEHGPFHAEHVLAENDFQLTDHTVAAKWPDAPFQPFRPLADLTPALYLGLDQPLPVDRVNLFFDVVEQPGSDDGPALVWEAWRGAGWRRVPVEDETRGLARPGMVSLIGPADAAPLARFGGAALFWLRARLAEDAPPAERLVRGIHPNAVWMAQHQTLVEESLGISAGRPGETFDFRHRPVLESEVLEVREVAGARAAVEWRLLAVEVLGDEVRTLRQLEEMLGREGAATDVELGDLRLRRDRDKKVSEVWVRWHPRRHLLASAPRERHYVLERARGRLRFGDGEHGRIPPAGAEVRARSYRSGGGRAGNVAAGTITQALAGVAGVEKVSNPRPAEGGADAETLAAVVRRGPRTVRHRGRGAAASDLETLAREASAAVAVARALPTRDTGGRRRPGHVTLVILPHGEEPRPQPSFGLREAVRRHVAARAAAGLLAAARLHVTGPVYQAIDVAATLVPRDPAAAGEVEQAARAALETFLHPLRGGPEGEGWEPGRAVYLSDVAAVLERLPGVDHVSALSLASDGRLYGESVPVAPGDTVVAGELRLDLDLDLDLVANRGRS